MIARWYDIRAHHLVDERAIALEREKLNALQEQIRFSSDVTVALQRSMASDHYVINAARVSTQGEGSLDSEHTDGAKAAGLIGYLMRSRHGSPFEHNAFTFYVQAPIFVFREFQRHRIASYNEESARYRQLAPHFYIPGPDRKLAQTGKPGHYLFIDGTPEQHHLVEDETKQVCIDGYGAYSRLLEAGVTREIARIVLPLTIYSSMYVTMNARSLMNFLSLRRGEPEATFPTSPQREIEMCAEKMETAFAELMPLTHQAFVHHGRVAP